MMLNEIKDCLVYVKNNLEIANLCTIHSVYLRANKAVVVDSHGRNFTVPIDDMIILKRIIEVDDVEFYDGDMKYFYMVKKGKGKRLESINASDVLVVDYEGKPHIKEYEHVFKNKLVRKLFSKPILLDNVYKIYIPKGTIKQNYNIDLK